MEMRFRERGSILLTAAIVTFTGSQALAAEWTVSSNLSAGLVYSDNIDLTATDTEDEIITVVTPSISLQGKGGRANVSLIGSVEFNDLSRGTKSVNPRMQANAGAEVVENLLFFDARAHASQNSVDPFSINYGNSLYTENSSTSYGYSLSPYISTRLADLANVELRYTFDDIIHSGNTGDNSRNHALDVSLVNGVSQRLNWGLYGSYKKSDYSDADDTILRSADLRMGYRINRKFRFRGSVGNEWNDYQSVKNDIDDLRWDVGMDWTPTQRTSLSASYGERFFGSTPSFSISHKSKKTRFTASYSRDVTDSNSLYSSQTIFQTTDEFGSVIDPFTGQTVLVPILARLPAGVFVDERLTASFSLQGKRTTLTLNGTNSVQKYQNVDSKSELTRIALSLTRRITPTSDVTLGYEWLEDTDTDDFDKEANRIWLSVNKKVGQKSNITLNYTNTQQDSDTLDDTYDENRVSVYFSSRF